MIDNKTNIEALVNKYPDLFSKHPRNIHFPAGWNSLVETLSAIIQNELNELPLEVKSSIFVLQVKSKFGGLRYYMNECTPQMQGAISMAESLSLQICEKCSSYSAQAYVNNGWRVTLCTQCHNL